MWSYDWLTMSQEHGSGVPKFGDDIMLYQDMETGEIYREVVRGGQHGGSFSTSLRIRCDGNRLEVSGNPSRYGRTDNVFGFRSMAQCVELYNEVLRGLGLPVFTSGQPRVLSHGAVLPDGKVVRMSEADPDGARISQVHINRGYSAGSRDDLRRAVRGLSSQVWHGKPGSLHETGNSCSWGRRDTVMFGYYDKGQEFRDHRGKRRGREWDSEALYCQRLQQWLDDVALLRFEVKLGRKMLARYDLNRLAGWSDARAFELCERYDLTKRMGVSVVNFDEVFDELRNQGETRRVAQTAQGLVHAWVSGQDVRAMFSASVFYRYAALARRCGIDVMAQPDITRASIAVRSVDLSPIQSVPVWYRSAA